jgi:ubiquitin C-terminal hydrolase
MDYKLHSIVEHEGTMSKGHYVTIRKRNGEWVEIDDETVKSCKNFEKRNAYLLVYKG